MDSDAMLAATKDIQKDTEEDKLAHGNGGFSLN